MDQLATLLSTGPNLIEQVHLRLVDAIADGTLRPGERLTQQELAERLGVSRQPISHALQLLRRQELVVEHGKRGIAVAEVDPKRISDLFQMRGVLDGLACRLAAEHVASGSVAARDTGRLRECFAAGLALAESASDVHAWIEADVAFHTCIYELSGNPTIGETVAMQWPHFKRCMGAVLANPERRVAVWREEHAAIVGAILNGNGDTARRAAEDHLAHAGAYVQARLEERSAAKR
jgi:DNA-binding GntR family transcriptional regulator